MIAAALPPSAPVPAVVRDPKDDYLIAHSVLEQVDYLVSGDKDLLVLGSVLGVRIVSPADFALLLRTLQQ
jgi:predicted nucleic acid-binding protein